MPHPNDSIELSAIWSDEHLLELRCRVEVSKWSGVADAYTVPADVSSLAIDLERFASDLQAELAWQAGADTGIGLIGLRFRTIDRARHVVCQVRLATRTATSTPEESWHLSIEMQTEAEAMLRFARQLRHMADERVGIATLSGLGA